MVLRSWLPLTLRLHQWNGFRCSLAVATKAWIAEPTRQRQLRELPEDSQAGRDLRQRVLRSRSSPSEHRGVHRQLLQPLATPLGARLQAARGVRTNRYSRDDIAGSDHEFFRHEEIFRSDVGSKTEGELAETGSPDHRLDESPADYSLAGRPPPEPASASPAEDHCDVEQAV